MVATAMFTGVVLYALFAGADFGAGFWELTADGAQRGNRLRMLIDRSIGPVWEANHIWLIYILMFLWAAYPRVYAAVVTTLFIPMSLALLGIVVRGADSVVRRHHGAKARSVRVGVLLAGASLMPPFFLGAVVGAIASGRVPPEGYGDLVGSWVNPTSFLGGLLAVGTAAFLAGVRLTATADRSGDRTLVEYLRPRTLVVGGVTGAAAIMAIAPIRYDAQTLGVGLLGRAFPLIALSATAGALTLILVYFRRFGWAGFLARVAVAAIVIGWAVAQAPWILVDRMLVIDAAGARPTLVALLVVVAFVTVTTLPALAYLLWLARTEAWVGDDTEHAESTSVEPSPTR